MLGSVSVNDSLTGPRCKNGTRECRENRNKRSPAQCGMFGGDTFSIHLKVMAYPKVV